MRIAICDDEKGARDALCDRVRVLCPDAEILRYSSGAELLSADCPPDILFLDIQMPGKNGMDTARELRGAGAKTVLIFVTALEEYVFQAFDVGAFHYLVKPFSDGRLEEVLSRALEQRREAAGVTPEEEERFLMVKTGGTHIKVFLKDIVYAEVFNRKVILHKPDVDVEYYGKMADLERRTGEDFFRSHRAYLVNFKYVEKYDASMIYLEKGSALMAKQNYPEFVKGYLKYNQRKERQWDIWKK